MAQLNEFNELKLYWKKEFDLFTIKMSKYLNKISHLTILGVVKVIWDI